MSAVEPISERALGRALLARQGLLERLQLPLVQAVEAIGAMQGQAWGALPVGLWTRLAEFAPADLYSALARRELLWGIGIRGTLHLVSAREHPAYATLAEGGWTGSWHRAIERTTPAMVQLRVALLQFTASEPRSNEEIRDFVEAWVGEHADAIDGRELAAQRELKWRPIYRWSALTRAPKSGEWGSKAPADHFAAPWSVRARARAHDVSLQTVGEDTDGKSAASENPAGESPAGKSPAGESPAGENPAGENPAGERELERAREQLVRAHLRAFGPAAAEDVACWLGSRTPPVRATLQRLASELAVFADEHGRTLYDLPDAPRPGPDTLAPPRLLGAFDSTLLAYAVKRRARIMPEALRGIVYQKANLQVRPSFLVDGLVAGTWSLDASRREAVLTLRPASRLARGVRGALQVEAEGLLRALHPGARAQRVVFE